MSTSSLNYTYPEFMKLDSGDPQSARLSLVRSVNELYVNPSLSASSASIALSRGNGTRANAFTSIDTSSPLVSAGSHGNSMLDWSVRIKVGKHALQGQSFTVFVFLSSDADVPPNPAEWFVYPAFVGEHSVFASSMFRRCANCQRQQEAGVITEGVVHLNRTLVGKVASFEPDDVAPFLQSNLTWRIQKVSFASVYPFD